MPIVGIPNGTNRFLDVGTSGSENPATGAAVSDPDISMCSSREKWKESLGRKVLLDG